MTDIEEIINKLVDFRNQRDWEQFHNSKDLALAINIEAGELLELFLWKNAEEANNEKGTRKGKARATGKGIKMDVDSDLNTEDITVQTTEIFMDDKIIWRQLSRLYTVLGETDILLGLAERVSTYPLETRRAIDAEVCGDYRRAVELYGDLLEKARQR